MPHPEFLSGEPVFAEEVTALAIRGTYTPELTAITTDPDQGGLGAVSEGKFYVTGALVYVEFHFAFGDGTTEGSGGYRVSVPAAYPIDAFSGRTALGQVGLRDDSTATRANRHVLQSPTDPLVILMEDQSGTEVTHDTPWIWRSGDAIRGSFTYMTTES